MTYKPCSWHGCPCAAQFAPKLLVPGEGYPQEESRSAGMICGLELCREHAENFDVQDFLEQDNGAIKQTVTMMVKAMGSSVRPDFKRAWVRALPLDGSEYAIFERMRSKQ